MKNRNSNLNLSYVRLDAAAEILRVSRNLQKGQPETNSLTEVDSDIESMYREPDRVYIPVEQLPNTQPSEVELLADGVLGQ
tara:strand:- start:592 stop:834 length:243 start_codon:yes stop_codon:yes gene_type:complete